MRFLTLFSLLLPAADFAVEPLKDGAPAEIAEAIRKEMAPAGSRVLRGGKPFVDFWFRNAVPTSDPVKGLGILYPTLRHGTLVGVARFNGGAADFKGQKFPAGVYTMRYAIQPEDGDHKGTAESRDFLLLSQAAADATPDTLEVKELNKLSAKVNGKKHPAVLWLVGGQGGTLPRVIYDETAERAVFEAEASAGGKPLRFSIVIVGKAAE
ncbi:MAG: hypothetical protein HY293_01655 [Planctomycetes bacterium]|nr:hypothetical protein [Planctomycetota bacterium]